MVSSVAASARRANKAMRPKLETNGSKPTESHATHVRHMVLALTVAAYMITYMDRGILATARPVIRQQLRISLVMMGWITFGFRMAYALFQIPGGWLGDRFGARRALSVIVAWWSIFTCFTGLAWNAFSMLSIQVLFGIGEAGAFPVATRSLARWIQPTERAFAQGVTHAGSRLGGAITPLLVVLVIGAFGWRVPFLGFGVLGVVWAAVWFSYYRDTPEEHHGVNRAERELIGSGKKRSNVVPWRQVLTHGNLWILTLMYFCYNYNLNVYNDWFPSYLHESRGLSLTQMGIYASLPLFAGTLGNLAGGYFSDIVMRKTGKVNLARRWVAIAGFLLSAAMTTPAIIAHDPKVSVAFYCGAFFGLEWTVGISWALPLDIGGDFAGSVSAVMNTFGNIGGAISSTVVTYTATLYGWNAPFMMTIALCLIAAGLYLKIDATKRIEI